MIKILIHEFYTKRDINGNVYHVVNITNPKTGKSFNTETPAMGNVTHIIGNLFPNWNGQWLYTTSECTGSARLSSMPSAEYLQGCHPGKDWETALRKIGYRIPKGVK